MVSLLSSGWDQVVPTCSGRQAKYGCKIAIHCHPALVAGQNDLGVIWSSLTVN